ncbi:hypothetical protein [Aquimarina sp. 2201CG5-10]|uniref:hypothetical protein n=1 Tax=Aquimarina callyspongiae TaxID=3098150 RepID=UPI002AB3BB7B|nr:hypothetical protein [Aquimarina sp. 2201CG5-10]MDY8135383.1 hypothetical protein [Aquimarina sp. 2201CG5-10]
MNRVSKRKSALLISAGILVIAFTQISSQYIALSDLAKGLLTGIGIGTLLIPLALKNSRSIKSN